MNERRLPLVQAMSRIDIDRYADAFLAKHFPDVLAGKEALPVLDLIDVVLYRDYGINNGVEKLPFGVEGLCEPPNRLTIDEKVYHGICAGRPHDLFTGAHEAIHALLHLPQIQERFESAATIRFARRKDMPAYRDPEWQANQGAAALLMPARAVWKLIGTHGYDPEPLKSVFQVSHTAASFRIADAKAGRLWRPGK